MKISLVVTGFVGSVTGACLADVGNDVVCLDLDARKIETRNRDAIPIFEPRLEELVAVNVKAGRLHLTCYVERAALRGEVQFIPVGTPPGDNESADLQHVLAATDCLADS